ncbi:MAG: helix-turn-helix transcriptional regulator [Acidobacteria bacterium]|nr:helix-turn-helix transcriptional regulator [Acidobacteriota bacterium]
MSVGKKILQLRVQSGRTQRDVAQLTGLAVSYLSRLENDRLNPSLRTLTKISEALRIPLTSFFDAEPVLESGDHCPVSPSGRCILDQMHVGRGRKPKMQAEGYSNQQLEVLRLCNFLLHQGNKEVITSLSTVMRSLLSLSASKGQAASRKTQAPRITKG